MFSLKRRTVTCDAATDLHANEQNREREQMNMNERQICQKHASFKYPLLHPLRQPCYILFSNAWWI